MIIPPVKIVEAGRIVQDVFTLILAQIRSKHETAGDLRAQIAANNTGVRRLQALVERHGRDTIVVDDGRAARLHRAAHRAPSSRRCRTASGRPRAASTPTATPTSPSS